jgi:hypothetical protein
LLSFIERHWCWYMLLLSCFSPPYTLIHIIELDIVLADIDDTPAPLATLQLRITCFHYYAISC